MCTVVPWVWYRFLITHLKTDTAAVEQLSLTDSCTNPWFQLVLHQLQLYKLFALQLQT